MFRIRTFKLFIFLMMFQPLFATIDRDEQAKPEFIDFFKTVSVGWGLVHYSLDAMEGLGVPLNKIIQTKRSQVSLGETVQLVSLPSALYTGVVMTYYAFSYPTSDAQGYAKKFFCATLMHAVGDYLLPAADPMTQGFLFLSALTATYYGGKATGIDPSNLFMRKRKEQ